MILSHGQAPVEGGFSANKDVLRCYLTKKSLVTKRIATDAVRAVMGDDSHEAHQINITSKMTSSLQSCWNALRGSH